ncbi:hypothetical protein [Burkholderia contaminans]|uniref:hypothetical protein n=1 Tax=Burkholderia contaminans TaxID=488447 RepID=UPI002D7F594E|nr:hypothetical protein [Burkholderia contaminans]
MNNGAPKLDLSFHPNDFAAMEQASRLAKIEPSEFCKLAIHVAARQTLAGAWPLGSYTRGTPEQADAIDFRSNGSAVIEANRESIDAITLLEN